MTVRINANSCKNALGTVFLLATAFFVCSTFISMRSVFADPIAPANATVAQSGRQSPRSTSRTSNRTVSRSTTTRGTVSPTRTTMSRGTGATRSVSSRSITPTRPAAGTRSVSARGNRTNNNQSSNRAVRARSGATQSRVSATGNVMSSGRASVNTTYSYLNSRLNAGNYSNIIDSTTGLISADAYANCMDSYYACMDEICTARSATKGRCSCAGRATNFLAAEEALERANEELIVLSGQLSLLIATKGKGDDLAAAFSLTDAEKVMNCVSWKDAWAKAGSTKDATGNTIDAATYKKNWCKEHNLYDYGTGSCVNVSDTSGPIYCTESQNNFGFDIKDIDGSSSDILAQLRAWADAKDLAKEFQSNDNDLVAQYTTVAGVINGLQGITTTVDTSKAALDSLANKWGYELYEYAHNNVCGRVLDSCFNGIYEACGTPISVTDSDGKTHSKCQNGATTSCPFNYNSYISVNKDTGDVELHERNSSMTNASSSASCFGYTTTTTSSGIRASSSSSTNDPYYSLRGPVADARRSIMQKYLLDSNSACDVYGTNLKNTAQNINYQKVAAEQALQQKRLEFKQQEEATVLADAKAAIDNFNECLSELWDCYDQYQDEENWTTARIKSYCSQTAQVPHCYEQMICSPLQSQLTAVVDKPDQKNCTFSADRETNTCRNVVTISEILYGTSTAAPVDITLLWSGTKSEITSEDSAAIREGCLRKALNCVSDGGDLSKEGYCLRNWRRDDPEGRNDAECTENSTTGYGYGTVSADRTKNGWATNYCRCLSGFTVLNGKCVKTCSLDEIRVTSNITDTSTIVKDASDTDTNGKCYKCQTGYKPNIVNSSREAYDCVIDPDASNETDTDTTEETEDIAG